MSTNTLPEFLGWLADAPMFIDEDQVHRFYDAVVAPDSAPGATTIQFTEESVKAIEGALKLEAGVEPGVLLKVLKPLFSIDVKGSGEAKGSGSKKRGKTSEITLNPISTPQRQLVQLALHYLAYQPSRLSLVKQPSDPEWRKSERIRAVPRQLVLLDLPSQDEAEQGRLPTTKLIPTAAEFADGKIVLLYELLKGQSGEEPPRYPEKSVDGKSVPELRKEYWKWYDQNFNATKAMLVVEGAAEKAQKRIHWIDYRVPLNSEGESLHLHISPAGRYDTGVFAYNFVKRGFKHGLRLVGTLKSEPDMNVLAIYEK